MNSLELLSALVIACSLVGSILASQCCMKESEYEFLEYSKFEHCEGKDASNFTLIKHFTRDTKCRRESTEGRPTSLLLSCSSNSKQTNTNILKTLAKSLYPDGAFNIIEMLSLVVAGPLDGKYVYEREVVQDIRYLKVCASTLSYAYVNSKSYTLLISERLDLSNLISPAGAFELFKKGCSTICQGSSIIVGPTKIIEINH